MDTRNREIINLGPFSKVLNSFFVYTGDLTDLAVQKMCREFGIWEQEETEWMIENIKPGWKCLDIGANNGYFTELLARLSGLEGEVTAFEPLNHLNENYKSSTKLNNYDHTSKITMHQIALSNREGEEELFIPSLNVGASRLMEMKEENIYVSESGTNIYKFGQDYVQFSNEKVKLKRLDSLYTETPDFIKIDVEGHEKEVFEGMHENTKKCKLIMLEIGWVEKEFIEYLNLEYEMSYVNGKPFDVKEIPNGVFNVILRKKN